MRYLEPSELVAINSVVTSPYGESCLVTDRVALESAVTAQQTEESPRAAAASLLETLLGEPAFQSGNLRTAAVAVLWLLGQGGLELKTGDDELATELRKMKSERWSSARIGDWLEGQLRPATSA